MTNKQKQNLLQYLGYYTGVPDNLWGPLSKQATKDFQKDYGLTADSIFGVGTEARILEVIATGEKPVEVVASSDAVQDDKGQSAGAEATDKKATGTFWDNIKYFKREEFRCQCKGKYCNGFPVEMEEIEVQICDEIRRRAGVSISIVDAGGSGVRCPTHNANVGGVANSEHMYGRAADLHSSLAPTKLKAIAEEVTAEMIPGKGGIGLYSWGVHVDCGKYSRWNG